MKAMTWTAESLALTEGIRVTPGPHENFELMVGDLATNPHAVVEVAPEVVDGDGVVRNAHLERHLSGNLLVPDSASDIGSVLLFQQGLYRSGSVTGFYFSVDLPPKRNGKASPSNFVKTRYDLPNEQKYDIAVGVLGLGSAIKSHCKDSALNDRPVVVNSGGDLHTISRRTWNDLIDVGRSLKTRYKGRKKWPGRMGVDNEAILETASIVYKAIDPRMVPLDKKPRDETTISATLGLLRKDIEQIPNPFPAGK